MKKKTQKKAVVADSVAEISPALVLLLAGVDVEKFRCDLLRGPDGEIAVIPTAGFDGAFRKNAPKYWTAIQRVPFGVAEKSSNVGVLELVSRVSEPAEHQEEWKRRVMLEVTDEEALGFVIRRLLAYGVGRMQYSKHASGYLLHVSDPSLIVLLEIADECHGNVFYDAPDHLDPQRLTGVYVPWGTRRPLLSALPTSPGNGYLLKDAGVIEVQLSEFEDVNQHINYIPPGTVATVDVVDSSDLMFDVPLRLEELDTSGLSVQQQHTIWLVPKKFIEGLHSSLAYATESKIKNVEAQLIQLGDESEPILCVMTASTQSENSAIQLNIYDGVEPYACYGGALKTLYLPAGYRLLPNVLPKTLGRAFSLSSDTLTILRRTQDNEMRIVRLQTSDFQPLNEAFVSYTLHARREQVTSVISSAEFDFGTPVVITPPPAPAPAPPTSTPPVPNANKAKRRTQSLASSGTPAHGNLEQPPANSQSAQNAPAADVSAEDLNSTLNTAVSGIIENFEAASPDQWRTLADTCTALHWHKDAHTARVQMLYTLTPSDARHFLTDCLNNESDTNSLLARDRLVGWAAQDKRNSDWTTVASHVLHAQLAAFDSVQLKNGTERQALTALSESVRELQDPRLSWLCCRASMRLLEDPQVLELHQLHVQECLRNTSLAACVPSPIAAELGHRAATQMVESVKSFVAQFDLSAGTRLWVHLLLALHWAKLRVPLTGPMATENLRAEAERNRAGIQSENMQRAEELIGVLEQTQKCDRCSAGTCDWSQHIDMQNGQSFVRALLVEEGMVHPPGATELGSVRLRQEIERRICAGDETATEALQEVWEEAIRSPENLSGLLEAIDPLWRQHDLTALRNLGGMLTDYRDTFSDATTDSTDTVMTRLLLDVGLLTLSMRLDPSLDITEDVVGLVNQLGQLSSWDREPVALRLLSALGELPRAIRQATVEPVMRVMIEIGVMRTPEEECLLTLRQSRILSRVVEMLKISPEETAEGERILEHQWRDLRRVVAEDYQTFTSGEQG